MDHPEKGQARLYHIRSWGETPLQITGAFIDGGSLQSVRERSTSGQGSAGHETPLHDKVCSIFTVASLGLATVLTVWGIGVLFGTLSESVNLIDRACAHLWITDADAVHAADPSLMPNVALRQTRRLRGVKYACGLNQLTGNLAPDENIQVQIVGIALECPLFHP
jgi:hypothetical protein